MSDGETTMPTGFVTVTDPMTVREVLRDGRLIGITTRYDASITVWEPDSPYADPKTAIRYAMADFLTTKGMTDEEARQVVERVGDARLWPRTVTVNGGQNDGWILVDNGVTIHAAVVSGGWTVVAVVSAEQPDIAVELKNIGHPSGW